MPAASPCADGQIAEPAGEQSSGIDWPTRLGMSLLYAGIAVSMAMLFLPIATEETISRLLLAISHFPNAFGHAAWSFPSVVPPAKVAQTLWLAGAICLCVQPLKTRNWSFVVTGSCIVLASVLPLLGISSAAALFVRTASMILGMLWLGSLEGMGICRALLPWNWHAVWRGEMGNTALAIVGSEILTWGYSLFAVSAILGWICLAAGSGVMMKFCLAGKREGIPIAFAWYRLNYV